MARQYSSGPTVRTSLADALAPLATVVAAQAAPMPAFDVLDQYPAWTCPACRFTGQLAEWHPADCTGELRPITVLLVTREAA